MVEDQDKVKTDEGKKKHTPNDVISYVCKLVALIICVVIFTTTILGKAHESFVILGLSLSVALIALALLQDTHQKR